MNRFFRIAAPAFVLVTVFFTRAIGQSQPAISQIDQLRLAEAFRLADELGDRVWPGWSRAPFAVLLVTPDYEFLVRHPRPSPDFVKLGYDQILKSDVYCRKRVFPTSLLATAPFVSGSMVSTIVVGQAENTSVKTSTPWVITLLHEHLHQLQDSQPKFYEDVNGLNLSRGDQTGMWMLNYAFPYERKDVQEQFVLMSKLLAVTINSSQPERKQKLHDYLIARQKFQSMVSADDYKYFAFECWKEGTARYTEYQVARLATKYQPSKEFEGLRDYEPFSETARKLYEGIFHQLATQKLGESKREVVYSFGAAEALLLDQINPSWRGNYFVEKFDLIKLMPRM